jgi:glyoxylase-like metal-dependent hydrolase (beta-lactamase superfamily II)
MPEVPKLAEGAWSLALLTPTLPPATRTNTVVFGGDRLLIVEPATPHPGEQARLAALLAELEAEGREVIGILLTHHHADHIGHAEGLRARLDVPILAHPATAARLDFEIDQHVDEGWSIELGGGHRVEVLHTPGHAPGHLIVWERASNVAHVGDMVAGEGTILVDPSDDGDMGIYLDSLRRMQALAEQVATERGRAPIFVPAHGPTLHDSIGIVRHYIAHRLAREQKVRRAIVEQGAREFMEIVRLAYADTPGAAPVMAAMSAEAHLRKLIRDGEIIREGARLLPSVTASIEIK